MRCACRAILALACIASAVSTHVFAQDGRGGGIPAIVTWVLPDLVRDVYAARETIAAMSDTLPDAREAHVRRIDNIYLACIRIAEGDPTRALLLCAIATLPYHRFPATIPLTGLVVHVPVSTESLAMFGRRVSHLPTRLLPDSLHGAGADKLPHFFGSAYLRISTGSSIIAELLGRSVELGEAVFKLEGFSDSNDLRANEFGMRFGDALLADENALPSSVLFSQSICR